MSSLIAELFDKHDRIADFRAAVIALDSAFALEREDLLAIGRVYGERYPESYSRRNPQHVQVGYAMARICVIEQALAGIEPELKAVYRDIFYQLHAIDDKIAALIARAGCGRVYSGYRKITGRIKEIEALVDSLPRGMIKEKFIGGLSVIYNVLYLMHLFIDKCMQE